MVAIAESTPGPVAVNSATYIGYKLAGVAGAAASTLAVCLPSFGVIYLISLFFDRFLQLTVVANAFKGIQACVIYLILSAGIKMLKNLQRTPFNTAVVAVVLAAMVGCSMLAVKFPPSAAFCLRRSRGAGLCGRAGEERRHKMIFAAIILELSGHRCGVLWRRLRHDLAGAGNSAGARLADRERISQLYRSVRVYARPAGGEHGHLYRRFAGGAGRLLCGNGGGGVALFWSSFCSLQRRCTA